jgi:hypothetical protein
MNAILACGKERNGRQASASAKAITYLVPARTLAEAVALRHGRGTSTLGVCRQPGLTEVQCNVLESLDARPILPAIRAGSMSQE